MDQRLTDLLTNQNAANLNVTSEYKLLRNPKAQKEVQKPVREQRPHQSLGRRSTGKGDPRGQGHVTKRKSVSCSCYTFVS